MRILLSNDDSVYANGLNILYQNLLDIAEVKVVAPDRDNSAASNSLTIYNPIRIKKIRENFISVSGTPTDSVHLAMNGLLDWKPDYIISGINHGANLGEDVLYSGTVAAAMEGMLLGGRAIAVSLASFKEEYLVTAAMVVRTLIKSINISCEGVRSLLNINVPGVPYENLQGISVTRLGSRHIGEKCIMDTDPRGENIFWIAPPGKEQDAGPGTDFYAIANNYVSITPINTDMTDYNNFEFANNLIRKMSVEI
ncbi:MAG: 5'/3'-nucleotidase SurE [Legionellales bacterium]|nr:5'/3'-nucleotidase SurE [Legionellales bacterium]